MKGSLPPFRENLQPSVNARRTGSPGKSFPQFTARLVRAKYVFFRFRLERAIADLKPTPINPTEHFWSVYKKTVDERFSRLSEKYKGTLDVITLWVSLFAPLAHIVSLTSFLPSVSRVYCLP